MKMRIGTKIFAVLLLAGGCTCGGMLAGARLKTEKPPKEIIKEVNTVDSVTLEEILAPASELVTLKYTYTDLDIFENHVEMFGVKVPFSSDKIVFTYTGTVSAGIELADVKYKIDDEHKVIYLTLPQPKLFSHEMNEDDFMYYDVMNSIMTETKMEDYTRLISELKAEQEQKLAADGEFYQSVTDNAKEVLTSFLTLSDNTKDYTVIYK